MNETLKNTENINNNLMGDAVTGGIEKGVNYLTGGIREWFYYKISLFFENLVLYGIQILKIGVVCYLFYLAFKIFFFKAEEKNIRNTYLIIMIYIIARLFWKVVFNL